MLSRRQIHSMYKWIKRRNGKFSQRFLSSNTETEAKVQKKWRSIVGLEIHAQIATESKLFSSASTNFVNPINSCVSFFDCATPGTLPVLNRKCVEMAVLTSLALSCRLNETSLFERKHYFYADLPAGFQITQQRQPIAVDGEIKFHVFTPGIHKSPYLKSSKIKQIQLEQDSGKSLHDENTAKSLIDLNRAGIPLMEFVFEPDLIDGEEAAALVKELTLILQLLGVCSGRMEEGALRIDANVSVSNRDNDLGVRTEIKNIGSVRAVAAAVKYEINRQISILEAGNKIFNETRAWNMVNKTTIPMREKEEKEDYRFMPETNLPPLRIHVREDLPNENNLVDAVILKKQLPKLPEQIRERLKNVLQISPEIIIALMSDLILLQLFDKIIKKDGNRDPTLVAKFLVRDLLNFLNKNKLTIEFCIPHADFIGQLTDLLQNKTVNLIIANKILYEIISDTKKSPKEIVEEHNWFLISDEEELEKMCLEIIEKNPKIVSGYKKGKKKLFIALMGQMAKITNQRADMALVANIMERLLKS
ncbi:glutamyl-tRNA(Gln) amidotransferase subunit B, mitochondrial isoform X1 [Camponotus floridanus]|uniref:glutamyl-tRNA(Gln) amidotransferase subunit B, mitochondrial isoform X1 n=2 Tax=Camponotus floridanus TaxID=104421 RepID=UPI00059C7AA3|nr:glutamyl-tRNA(Gln) amidotransferase subunit B, mitochondrial isoform X1 [Camponotus floridanus]